MHWILQDNIFNEEAFDQLEKTLARLDLSYSIHKVIPFIGELSPEPNLSTDNVICIGSYSMRHYAKVKGWNPGVFDLEPFDFAVQLINWEDHMLNADSVITTFENAVFAHPEMFIRPVEDSKVFAGMVIGRSEFNEWREKVCNLEDNHGTSLTKSTWIQVSPIKKIYSEHRFWIVKGQIVSASTYKTGNRVAYSPLPESIYHEFVRDRVSEWQPHDAFVIDVADTPNGIKVIEINTLNSCGFYACDIQRLVMALEEAFSV